jgi:hypothetical protein
MRLLNSGRVLLYLNEALKESLCSMIENKFS